MSGARDRFDWGLFGPILSVQFIGTLSYSIALPFLVFLVTDLGGAAWTYGIVGATYSFFQLLGAPAIGRWSDRVGRRRALIWSQAGTALSWGLILIALYLPRPELAALLGASLTPPLLLLFFARALDGVTGGNVAVANALVADLTVGRPERRQRAYGRMGMAASLGFVLGPAIAGALGWVIEGYWAPVGFAALVSAGACALCTRIKESRPAPPCDDRPEPPCVSHVLGQDQRRDERVASHPKSAALSDPTIALLLAVTFAQFIAYNLFYAGFPVHAQSTLGWGPGKMGGFFALLAGAMLFVQGPLLDRASEHLRPALLFGVGMSALAASLALLWIPAGWAAWIGALLYAFGNGFAWPTFQARLSGAAPDDAQGVVNGAATSAGSLASIVGLIAGAFLYDGLGSALFLIGAGIFALLAILSPLWFQREALERG